MRNLTTSPLARAKERLRIPDLWDRLALDGTPSKSCRSPFRDDRAPSFSVSEDGLLWNDFAEGTGGDAVDLLAKAAGLDNREAARRFIEMAGGSEPSAVSITRRPKPAPARKFRALPDLQPWELSDAMTLARLRRWPLWAGLEIAARRGLLGAVDLRDGSGPPVRCWAVTDDRRAVMQARRLDGEPFAHRWDGTARKWTPCPPFKSKTLCADPAGAGWPVGAANLSEGRAVVFCEGGPDFAAAFGLAFLAGLTKALDVVTILGAGNKTIAAEALPKFAGKRIRFLTQGDTAGRAAVKGWASQLKAAGAGKVDAVFIAPDPHPEEGPDAPPIRDVADFLAAERTHQCPPEVSPLFAGLEGGQG